LQLNADIPIRFKYHHLKTTAVFNRAKKLIKKLCPC
jgi:hypothetical protein